MRSLVYILFVYLILCSSQVYGQDSTKTRKSLVIYVKEKSNITEVIPNNDTTSAIFKIALKGRETKGERIDIAKKYRKKGLPFPMFYFTFIADKPQKICSLSGIDYITAREFREGDYNVTGSIIIIHELEGGGYLKWDAIYIPYM